MAGRSEEAGHPVSARDAVSWVEGEIQQDLSRTSSAGNAEPVSWYIAYVARFHSCFLSFAAGRLRDLAAH